MRQLLVRLDRTARTINIWLLAIAMARRLVAEMLCWEPDPLMPLRAEPPR